MYSTYDIAEAVAASIERDPSLGDEADVQRIELGRMMSRRGGDTVTLIMENGQKFVLTFEEVR